MRVSKSYRVVKVLSASQIVLNVGSIDGISIGNEFIIYGLSEDEIMDPETNQSLGHLELYRGVGYVTYVQDTMCILQAIAPTQMGRLQASLGGISDIEFINPQVNDYAKPNATKIQSSKKS